MDKTNIILDDGSSKEVDCIFYLYNAKYYFIYTLKEIDDNGYVILNVVQVGKEVNQTPNGPVDTGYLIGVDIKDETESELVQSSITKIVEDKKNGTHSEDIQYLPISMLTNLKIVSKKTFRLLKPIVEQYFGIVFNDNNNILSSNPTEDINSEMNSLGTNVTESTEESVIVDYRSKFFEEQEKNQELEHTIFDLQEKLNSIKHIIE